MFSKPMELSGFCGIEQACPFNGIFVQYFYGIVDVFKALVVGFRFFLIVFISYCFRYLELASVF